jgi:hypothetical protein
MGIVKVLPDVEEWLDAEADSWSTISDPDYVALVRRWRDSFWSAIKAERPSLRGHQAIHAVGERLPADVWLLSGIQVPELANMGGQGAAGYQVAGLRSMKRELANRFELVVAPSDLSWTCVFSHEGNDLVWECFFELTAEARSHRKEPRDVANH